METRPEKLFDLNLSILRFFLDKTGILADIRFTEEFTAAGPGIYGEDLRETIHPKKGNSILEDLTLANTWKYGFASNLSIMDLLFNEGPDAILYLKKI